VHKITEAVVRQPNVLTLKVSSNVPVMLDIPEMARSATVSHISLTT